MSEQRNDKWEKLWQEYSNSLKKWNDIFELFKKASNEIQITYNEITQMIISESSKDMIKFFDEDWQKAVSEYGVDSFKKFGQGLQKSLYESSLESMKAYGQMINTFGESLKKIKKDSNLPSQTPEDSALSDEEIMEQFTNTKEGETSRMSQRNKE